MPSAFLTTDFFSPLALAGDFLRSSEEPTDTYYEPLTQTQIDDEEGFDESDDADAEELSSSVVSLESKEKATSGEAMKRSDQDRDRIDRGLRSSSPRHI